MTEQQVGHRPRRVTVAAVMAAAACALLVVSLFDSMARVRSAETRNEISEFLRQPPGAGLELGVDSVVDVLRGVVLLSGALAAAGTVLAIYTLRRHRGARIGLTVIAVLLLFSATFVAGVLPVVVAVAATMLWSREARDWFDGTVGRPAQAAVGDGGSPGQWPPPQSTPSDPSRSVQAPSPPSQSPPSAPSGPAPTLHPTPFGSTPQAVQQPAAWAPPSGATALRPGSRPPAVTVAAWLTWVFAAVTLFAFGLVVLVMLAARSEFLEALQRDPTIAARGWSSREILGGLWVISAVAIVWSLAAMALAVLAFRRVNAGRVGLVVSAALSGAVGVCLLVVGWPHAVAAFTTVGLLLSGRASRWYAHRDEPRPQQPPPPPAAPQRSQKPPVW
jgi:hypothetical protein